MAPPPSAVWDRHRLAVSGALGRLPASALEAALTGPDAEGFFDFLLAHGLTGFWWQGLVAHGLAAQSPPALAQRFKTQQQADAAQYLLQSHALRRIGETFDQAGIDHAVLKGCAVRELLHDPPHQRSATDIDILVRPAQRARAADALAGLGYRCIDEGASAHEATWRRGRLDIDLHWDILAPGRTRSAMADALVDRRVRAPMGWRLDDADTVALMLIHPAVTKYVCSPHVGLNRVVDFSRFVQVRPPDWTIVADRVQATGLAPAAWTMARWLRHLGVWPEGPGPDQALESLAPGAGRRRWLGLWVDRDWPGRWTGRHDAWVAVGFTLAFHERPSDLARALAARLRRRRRA